MEHSNYKQLASRLGVARRAYKRMTTLAGAVVFLIEALGTMAIVIAADVLFDLGTGGRIALFAIAAIALAYFAFRHIVKPLTRSISDQQLALYLEQRDPRFEGSLIAATEFSQNSYSGRVAQIVDSILDQAVARAGKFDLKKAIDLARLRKYGIVAGILIALYVVAAVTMPQATSRRLARVFTPWKKPPVEALPEGQKPIIEAPLVLAVAGGDSSLVRGGTLQLAATASRTPKQQMNFHFRALAANGTDSAWKMMPMSETEKLNDFKLTLPDVNEDLEFFVSAENIKTEPHRVTVFDPLLIKSYEVTTKFPSYLKFKDRTDKLDSADLTAVVGSNITLKMISNGTLASGKVEWDGKEALIATIDTADKSAAVASFEVKESGAFKLSVTDIHGQAIQTPAAASLSAMPDVPPTIKLTTPTGMVTANPMAEITFAADVTDDLALEGAALVMTRGVDPAAVPTRIPLTLNAAPTDGEAPVAGKTVGLVMLEQITPKLMPGESLSCYIEVSDRKGQVTPSDLIQIVVVPFESWAAYSVTDHKPHEHPPEFHLEPILAAAWRLHAGAGAMAPNDLNKQLDELAKSMADDAGVIHPYFNPEGVDPEKAVHGNNAQKLAVAAQESLKKHDHKLAVAQLRAAVAELTLAGVIEVVVLSKPPEAQQAAMASSETKKEIEKLTALMEKPKPESAADKSQRSEKDAAEEAAKNAATAEALEAEQAKLTEKIKKAADGSQAAGKANAPQTAADQEKLAAKTEAAAKNAKDNAKNDEAKKGAAADLNAAAGQMKDAAEALKKGDNAEAARKAEAAGRSLASAKGKAQTGSQDAVNATIDKAQAKADQIAAKQNEVNQKTDAADKAGGKEKDAQAKGAAADQVKIGNDAKDLAAALNDLVKAAEGGAMKPDAAKNVADAKGALNKGRLESKINNAAVMLANGDTAGAAAEQKKIKDVLDNVAKSLENASGARAGDKTAALKRAKNDAAQAKANLDDINAKGEGKADGKDPAAQAAAKKEAAQAAAAELARLGKQLQARNDLGAGNKAFDQAVKTIAEKTKEPAKLADELEKVDSTAVNMAKVAAVVKDHLEAEYAATLKSQELFASQREDCPPQYRPLVNKYFESIATGQ